MAKDIIPIDRYSGLSYSEKEGPRSSFLFGRSIDYRTDPTKLTILPRTIKESGSVVTDLILDADRQGDDVYGYGNTGKIYKRDSNKTWTLEHTAANSTGNGIKYFGEDSWIYYTQDKTIGRHGPFWGTTNYTDDFLGAQGGVPLNTASLVLNGTTQYATAADHSSLDITSDISIEAYIRPDSLPAVGETQMMISKWNENGNQRSYYFGVSAVSGFFGDGSDSALTISSNTTQSLIDSAATATGGTSTITATNASFATGQKILIHQTRGTGAGKWERREIASYTAGTITTTDNLTNSYTSGAQVIVLRQYTNVTVNSSVTWTAKAWNGTVGGLLCFLANGTVTVNGIISANGGKGASSLGSPAGGTGGGFRGGAGHNANPSHSIQGEGTSGAGGASTAANGNGGGGAGGTGPSTGAGGGGGGNAASGSNGTGGSSRAPGTGGAARGTSDLTTLVFGGGGGGGTNDGGSTDTVGGGGSGGGIVFIIGSDITVHASTGLIRSNGGDGGNCSADGGSGGGGAGGSILLKAQTATLGTNRVTAAKGVKGSGNSIGGAGGDGSVGRIHVDYLTSVSGTTSPTLNSAQDSALVTTTTYRLVLGLSSNGTNEEFLSQNLDSYLTDSWVRYQVTWDASASTARFYLGGTLLGTATGALTAINDSTALLAVGASFDSATGAAENFFDGKVDDFRMFNDIRTASELVNNNNIEIGQVANLQAYYQFDSSTADDSVNTNTLTLVGSPVYDTADVPFASPTTRLDRDQNNDSVSGQIYALTAAISEGATHRQTFIPTKDPQKSIEVNISAIGSTADWTLTVHDAQNRLVASKTVTNANLNTGKFEFIFDNEWRPVLGLTYHFHLTATNTTGAPAAVSGTASDLENGYFVSYFQFLVDDEHHAIEQVLNFLAIGNERYLATWDGIDYNPHKLTLPSGFRIRCLGIWREYLVMGTTKGSSLSDYDEGYLFFWNGLTDTYSFYMPVPQGGVNAIMGGDPLYFIAGYSGDLMKYEGGRPKKVLRFPKITDRVSVEVNRKAMVMWRALVRVGLSGESDSSIIERGVYTWGALDSRQEESLSYDYPLSLGITQDTNLEIGMILPVGTELLISWKSSSNYGVDVVSPTNNPYATARYESLITDANKIWHDKMALTIRGYFKTLETGDSVQLEYKIDRESTWNEGTAETTAGKKETRLSLPVKGNRFNEFQVAVDLETSNSVSPEFYGLGIHYDDLGMERRV